MKNLFHQWMREAEAGHFCLFMGVAAVLAILL